MEELIKITQDTNIGEVVSARELYAFLEVNSNFTTWCTRMFEYGFEQGKDFIPILEESKGGRPSTDYVLTLDTAKEISMIQRSAKGKQAREYFIQCERLAKAPYLSRNAFTVENGKIITNTKLLAKASSMTLKEVNEVLTRWIEQYCDYIMEGDPIYFHKYRLVPKTNGGIIANMLCANVTLSGNPSSADTVFYLSDIALLRFIDRGVNLPIFNSILPILKDEIAKSELTISAAIYDNKLLSSGENVNVLDRFFKERYSLFSNLKYANKVFKEFCKQNDIVYKVDSLEFKTRYLNHGNRLK